MTATLYAVQEVVVNGIAVAPGTIFTTDDVSAAALLANNQAATSVAQETANAATFPIVPADDPTQTNA